LTQGKHAATTGIDDENVQTALFAFDLCEQTVKIFIASRVGLNANCVVANFSDGLIECILAASGDIDPSAFAGEKFRRCEADTAGGSRYNRNLVIKSVGHSDLLSSAVRTRSARKPPAC